MRDRTVLPTFALIAALALGARAQSPAPTPVAGGQEASQEELRELFQKVERRLREIDRLLGDAGAGDVSKLAGVGASGIDELLRTARERQGEVIEDIDRMLEIASQLAQTSESGGGGGQPQPQGQGQSPLDRSGQATTDREGTPSQPQGSQPQPQPQPQPGQDPKGQSPQDQQGDPKDPRASRDRDPQNQPSGNPAAQPTDAPRRPADEVDRWGDLPVHARDVFRAEGGGDMPVQYRDWIDGYYRRLNRKK